MLVHIRNCLPRIHVFTSSSAPSFARSHDGSKGASQLTLQDSAGEELELLSLAPVYTVLLSLLLRWQGIQTGTARLQ